MNAYRAVCRKLSEVSDWNVFWRSFWSTLFRLLGVACLCLAIGMGAEMSAENLIVAGFGYLILARLEAS